MSDTDQSAHVEKVNNITDDTVTSEEKIYRTEIKDCVVKIILKELKLVDTSVSKGKNLVSAKNLTEKCGNKIPDINKVLSSRQKKTIKTDANNFITYDEGIILNRNDLNSSCNSDVMDELRSMDGKHSYESVSDSNCSEDPLNVSEPRKGGRNKLLKITGDKINGTNKDNIENSTLVSAVDKSSTDDVCRTIKTEPNDEEFFHMSCDEVSLSETSEGMPQVKKKRGRPKKNPNDSRSLRDKLDKGSSDEGKKLSKRTESDEVKSVCSGSSGDKLPVKRGRGRPRKSDTDSLSKSVVFYSPNDGEGNSLDSGSRSSLRTARQSILSERKRRIVKPKRFDSFESFDFMDVNDRNSCLSNETSVGDNDDLNGSDIMQTDIRDDEDEEDEDEEKKQKSHDGGGDAKPKIIRRRRRVEVPLVSSYCC